MSLWVTPALNKVFALSLILTDGLLFVGMLNSQNSLLNENVVAIWYYIILCRGFQFAATYFMDGVLFASKPEAQIPNSFEDYDYTRSLYSEFTLNAGANAVEQYKIDRPVIEAKKAWDEKYSQILHSGIAVVFSHLSSLWCMIIVLFHFVNASSVPLKISELGISTGIHQIQIAFVAFIAAMDFIKHVIAFLTVWGQIDQWTYKWCILSTYTADWLFRAVFIICMLFPITTYLGDVFIDLHSYLVS